MYFQQMGTAITIALLTARAGVDGIRCFTDFLRRTADFAIHVAVIIIIAALASANHTA